MSCIKNKIVLTGVAFCGFMALFSSTSAAIFDTEDPMYFEQARDFTIRGGLSFGDDILDVGLKAAYGINDIFVFGTTVKYQQDFNDERDYDGFSYFGFDAMYRMSNGAVKSDLFGGIKVSGDADPRFDKNIYFGGVRIGRSWDWVTLSGALKSSWIFDELNGMAWIDIMPDIYFRLSSNWRIGLGADFRKSTNPIFDTTIVNAKLVRQYGRTQYVGFGEYDFEQNNMKFGTRVNISF
ncbi:MAG: hypothetical protein GX944_02575 [Alphaproteobacteria bacterium]|nr:hypothetical protein [Alphaproteobacteria bacterium]